MKINILCLKSTILFITATYRIFVVTHNTLNQTFNIKKGQIMLHTIKQIVRFRSHNIYCVCTQYTHRALAFLTSLIPLFSVIGDILAVMSIFALGYIFLHFGQPINPWTP